MPEDIHSLWQRVLKDDRAAWGEIVGSHAPLVFTVAVRAGLDPADAEDCGQQVWLALYRHRRKLRDPQRLPAWLIQTTRRRAMRMLRQKSLRGRRERNALNPEPGRLQEDELLRLERLHLLEAALVRLEPRCRKVLRALFLAPENTSYAELARSLGLSPNALGPLRSRCLKRLRKILQELGYPVD